MRKVLLLVVAIATFGFASAQMEAKVNPLGAMFGKPDISGEYIVTDNFGVEASVSFAFGKVAGVSLDGAEKPTQSGLGFKVAGKYYFSPDDGGDGWYGGIYIRQESRTVSYSSAYNTNDYKSDVFAGGVEFGRKWVFDSGFLIELAAGVGRPFSEKRGFINSNSDYDVDFSIGVDFIGKFAIGYRFM